MRMKTKALVTEPFSVWVFRTEIRVLDGEIIEISERKWFNGEHWYTITLEDEVILDVPDGIIYLRTMPVIGYPCASEIAA